MNIKLLDYMTDECKEALFRFLDSQPQTVIEAIKLDVGESEDKVGEQVLKLFLKTSDYAKSRLNWIDDYLNGKKGKDLSEGIQN